MYSCTKSSLKLLLFTFLLMKEASFKIPELSDDILASQCAHLSEAKIKSQSFVVFSSPEIFLDRLNFPAQACV